MFNNNCLPSDLIPQGSKTHKWPLRNEDKMMRGGTTQHTTEQNDLQEEGILENYCLIQLVYLRRHFLFLQSLDIVIVGKLG